VLALTLSLLLLAALFLHLEVSPREVLEQLEQASLAGLAAVIVIHLGALAAKVRRWNVLLAASGLDSRLPDSPEGKHLVQDAVFCGWLGNLLLPAKTGELVRPLLYARRTGEAFSRVVATVVIERSIDLLVLALAFWAAITLIETGAQLPPAVPLAAQLAGLGGLAILAALFLLHRLGSPAAPNEAIDSMSVAEKGVRQRISSAIRAFRLGLSSFQSPAALVAVFCWTAASWALEVLGAVCCLSAFGLRLDAVWGAATAHVVATTLAVSAVPLPGGVGVEQPVTVAVFQPFSSGPLLHEAVLAVSLLLTLASIAWVVPLGVLGLVRQGARLGAGGLKD